LIAELILVDLKEEGQLLVIFPGSNILSVLFATAERAGNAWIRSRYDNDC
jgi:hypothetical protein